MPKTNNFVKDFKNDHSQLLKLIDSFRKTVESSNFRQAKEIIDQMNTIANGHFNFEETYLYPRLRRLVSEITQNLHREQETMRDFIKQAISILDSNRLNRNNSTRLLSILPRLSKHFENCDDLVFLINKFNEDDKDDLELRFKQCCESKSVASVQK